MSGKKQRPPLQDIPFGSGMTADTRPPAITDQPYRDKIERGEPVDSRVRISADEPFNVLRWRCERFCKETFEAVGLPDPFSFIHDDPEQHALDGHFVTCGGYAEVQRVYGLGYRLAAAVYRPEREDHSDICFAVQMAVIITRFDQLKAGAEGYSMTMLADYAAQYGAALGRLAEMRGLKIAHEDNAISGRKQRESNRRKGKQSKRRKWAEELADLITSWDEIPDSHDPLVVDALEADRKIFRDGENVVCVVDGKETKLARITFEKRYLRPSLKSRGQ